MPTRKVERDGFSNATGPETAQETTARFNRGLNIPPGCTPEGILFIALAKNGSNYASFAEMRAVSAELAKQSHLVRVIRNAIGR